MKTLTLTLFIASFSLASSAEAGKGPRSEDIFLQSEQESLKQTIADFLKMSDEEKLSRGPWWFNSIQQRIDKQSKKKDFDLSKLGITQDLFLQYHGKSLASQICTDIRHAEQSTDAILHRS